MNNMHKYVTKAKDYSDERAGKEWVRCMLKRLYTLYKNRRVISVKLTKNEEYVYIHVAGICFNP